MKRILADVDPVIKTRVMFWHGVGLVVANGLVLLNQRIKASRK